MPRSNRITTISWFTSNNETVKGTNFKKEKTTINIICSPSTGTPLEQETPNSETQRCAVSKLLQQLSPSPINQLLLHLLECREAHDMAIARVAR